MNRLGIHRPPQRLRLVADSVLDYMLAYVRRLPGWSRREIRRMGEDTRLVVNNAPGIGERGRIGKAGAAARAEYDPAG
jgi:hypothetical protein